VVGVVAVAFGAFDEGVASVFVLDSVSRHGWSWGGVIGLLRIVRGLMWGAAGFWLSGWLRIRVFWGLSDPCEGGVFWRWGIWSSVEGGGCGGLEALNPSHYLYVFISSGLIPLFPLS
jgi:hypothetical protein